MPLDKLRKFSILYLHASDNKIILGKMKYWTKIFSCFCLSEFLHFFIMTNMYVQSKVRITNGIDLNRIGTIPLLFITSICIAHMNVYARFDEF